MTGRRFFGSIAMMLVLSFPVQAGGNEQLQKYFSDVASKVKATDNASEKRDILITSFQTMSTVLGMVQNSGLVSKNDCAALERMKVALQEKQDELSGRNGFVRVADGQLNAFSDYVVQDMEQASGVSLVVLLLIIILVVLLV